MLKATLTSVRTGENLDLDEISMNGMGVQAVSGTTGFGLPPLDVQWFEGAGDGSKFRNARAQSRDLDIPLFIYAPTRLGLRQIIAKMSRVVAMGEMILTLTDDDEDFEVWTRVHRTGGGTYTYGSDSTGEHDWEGILTIRAGDPYWYTGVSPAGTRAYAATDTFTITNPGTAQAYPTFTFKGPLTGLSITNNLTGESYSWSGNLNIGETLTFDHGSARVTDSSGASRYTGLSVAPSLFALDAGDTSVTVTITKPTSLGVRHNYVINPSFESGGHAWSASASGGGSGFIGVVANSDGVTKQLQIGSHGSFDHQYQITAGSLVTACPANTSLQFRAQFGGGFTGGIKSEFKVVIDGGATYTFSGAQAIVQDITTGASGNVTFQVHDSANLDLGYGEIPCYVDNLYLGEAGEYFDGDVADTANIDYGWSGTVRNSVSTAAVKVQGDPTSAWSFAARDWMVV